MPRAAWLLVVPAAVLGLLFALPMGLVLGNAADGPAWQWLLQPYARDTIRIAAEQAALSTLLAMALAVPLACLYHARRIRGERLHLAIHAAPFVMPVFVVVYGLQATLGERGWQQTHLGGAAWLTALGPLGAVVIAHAYYNYGFAARLIHAALERRPRRLEDAARTLGASPTAATWRITVPLLLPTLAAVALLVFLFCFASFGTVLLLGQGSVRTIETVLYTKVNQIFPDMHEAAVLGVVQLVLGALLLAGYLALRRRSAMPEPTHEAPRAGAPATVLSWLLLGIAVAPMLAVLVGGFQLGGHWSLAPWRNLLSNSEGFELGHAAGLSLLYAGVGTLAACLLCACLAYGAARLPAWARRAVEAAGSIPMAASSILIGVGFILTFGVDTLLPLAYTVWIVLLAHIILVFPFAARILLPAFAARSKAIDEAAILLGAPPAAVARRIHWPLMRRPILVAAGFCAAMSLGDFGASAMLSTTDTSGLAVWTQRLDGAFDPLLHARATALAGLLGVLALIAYLIVERAGRVAKEPL